MHTSSLFATFFLIQNQTCKISAFIWKYVSLSELRGPVHTFTSVICILHSDIESSEAGLVTVVEETVVDKDLIAEKENFGTFFQFSFCTLRLTSVVLLDKFLNQFNRCIINGNQ